jgi:hypothetical protein
MLLLENMGWQADGVALLPVIVLSNACMLLLDCVCCCCLLLLYVGNYTWIFDLWLGFE